MRKSLAVPFGLAILLALSPVTRWEQDQAADAAWAVEVGRSPSRRPPIIEVTMPQGRASVYDAVVLQAAGRRLAASFFLCLAGAALFARAPRQPPGVRS